LCLVVGILFCIPFTIYIFTIYPFTAVTLALPRIVVSVSTCGVAAIIQSDGSFPALAGIEQ